jgi:hypothetical protein
VDENGVSQWQKDFDAAKSKSDAKNDAMIAKAWEEMPIIGWNMPEDAEDETYMSLNENVKDAAKVKGQSGQSGEQAKRPLIKSDASSRGPSITASRKAAAALSVLATTTTAKQGQTIKPAIKHPTILAPRSKKAPTPTNPSNTRHHVATASKTTLGYSQGRAASTTLKSGRQALAPKKPSGNTSNSSAITSTKSLKETSDPMHMNKEWRRQKYMPTASSDDDDDDLEPVFRGLGADILRRDEEAEQDFVLSW